MKEQFYKRTAELASLAALATNQFEKEYKKWVANAMAQHCEDVANPDCVDFEEFATDVAAQLEVGVSRIDLERMRLTLQLDGIVE